MSLIEIRELLAAGVHYGHKTQRWNPKMARYLYGARNEIHIFDLQQTVRSLDEVSTFLWDLVRGGGSIVFVGTKRQARDAVREAANACGQYYVMERWLGGTLTNFQTIKLRIQKLRELRALQEEGAFDSLSKRDARIQMIELDRLERKMGGIAGMGEVPQAVFIIDPKREAIAVKEAAALGIPVIGLVDSNCDPTGVDYVIPGNDDSIRSLNLILGRLAESLNVAFEQYETERLETEQQERVKRERQEQLRRESAKKQAKPLKSGKGGANSKSKRQVSDGNGEAANTKSATSGASQTKTRPQQTEKQSGVQAPSSDKASSPRPQLEQPSKSPAQANAKSAKAASASSKSRAKTKPKAKANVKAKAKTKTKANTNAEPKGPVVKEPKAPDNTNQKDDE